MNKNMKIIVGVVVLALVGGGIYFATQNKDDSTNNSENTSQNQSTENQNQSSSEQQASFAPLSTKNTAFVATFTTSDPSQQGALVIESDGKGTSRLTVTRNNEKTTTIYTTDAYYLCQGDNCIKYPIASANAGQNPAQYDYDESDIAAAKNSAKYQGQQSCPAGTCDVWVVTEEDGHTTSVYVDTKTKRVSQVEAEHDGEKTKIVYEYKAVTINIPTNAQSIPGL